MQHLGQKHAKYLILNVILKIGKLFVLCTEKAHYRTEICNLLKPLNRIQTVATAKYSVLSDFTKYLNFLPGSIERKTI